MNAKMAPQAGIEPATCCLEGSCSVQLSYWGVMDGGNSRPCCQGVQDKTATKGHELALAILITPLCFYGIFTFT